MTSVGTKTRPTPDALHWCRRAEMPAAATQRRKREFRRAIGPVQQPPTQEVDRCAAFVQHLDILVGFGGPHQPVEKNAFDDKASSFDLKRNGGRLGWRDRCGCGRRSNGLSHLRSRRDRSAGGLGLVSGLNRDGNGRGVRF